MICEYIKSCPFIKHMSNIVPFAVNMAKIQYCEYDKHQCERYKLSELFPYMELPDDLWPSDETKALEIIEMEFREY